MSWPMWNQPVAQPVAQPDVIAGLSGFTPEQWATMQQQQWHQWAQYQQQYSQWQMEYGDKYSEQMKGAQPPLPAVMPTAPPPPPPDAPPPSSHSNQQDMKPSHSAAGSRDLSKSNSYGGNHSVRAFDSQVPPPSFGQSNTSQSYGYQNSARDSEQKNYDSKSNQNSYDNSNQGQINYDNSNRSGNNIQKTQDQNAGKGSRDSYNSSQNEQRQGANRRSNNFNQNADAWNDNSRSGTDSSNNYGNNNYNTSQNRSQGNSSASNFKDTKQNKTEPAPNPPDLITEEEKQFDNQFKKWEEDFFKWKEQNVNHPDKAAYREYEMTFEACRDQLIQRKEQMRARRNASSNVEKPKPTDNMQRDNTPYEDSNSQSLDKDSPQEYPGNNYDDPSYDYDNYGDQNYDGDNYEDSANQANDYNPEDGSDFLNSQQGKGIPGLDLVDEDCKTVDMEEDREISQSSAGTSSKKPDLSEISKGINSILGDTKLLQMLSMVRQNIGPSNPPAKASNDAKKDDGRASRWSGQSENNTPSGGGDNQKSIPNTSLNMAENSGSLNFPNASQGQQAMPYFSNQQAFMGNHMAGMVPHPMPIATQLPSLMGGMGPKIGLLPAPAPQGMWNTPPGMTNMPPGMALMSPGMANMPPGMTNMPPGMTNMPPGMANMSPGMRANMPPGMRANMMQHAIGNVPLQSNQGMRSMPQGMDRMNPTPNNMPQANNRRPLMDTPVVLQNRNNSDTNRNNFQNNPDNNPMRNIYPNNNMNRDQQPVRIGQPDYDIMDQRFGPNRQQNPAPQINPPAEKEKPKWLVFPLIEPVTILDYQHQSVKRGGDFLEPVQTFDYNHVSTKKTGQTETIDLTCNDNESYSKRSDHNDTLTSENYPNKPVEGRRENWDRNTDYHSSTGSRVEDRYKDDRNNDRYGRRNDRPDRERDNSRRDDRDRDTYRRDDRDRDSNRRDDRNRNWNDDRNYRDRSRDRSRDRRGRNDRSDSRDRRNGRRYSETRDNQPKQDRDQEQKPPGQSSEPPKNMVMIDDLLETPGREVRPGKIAIILRGLPGSGKSYIAKLIKDRELENGGSPPRILSIDDYYMSEVETDVGNSDNGRKEKVCEMNYKYDSSMEEMYITSLAKAFKKTLTDGFFSFIIVDATNDQHHHFRDMLLQAKQYGFMTYICEMDKDPQACHRGNIHGRSLSEVVALASKWFPTPSSLTVLDPTTLLQSAAIDHVQMEDVSDEDVVEMEQAENPDQEEVQTVFTSKWDRMDQTDKLARLDGISKPLRHAAGTMEDFLQLDEWTSKKNVQPGKKTVRWADIEERMKQEKMRAIGFVVGQTDWHRMTDPTKGSAALTQTKYIERVNKY